MSADQDSYRLEVIRRIQAAVGAGASDLISVLARCEGADPVFVRELYEKEFPTRALTTTSTFHIRIDPADPRISLRLPAPDPATCQWWFTSNAIQSISELVEARASLFSNRRIFCLGTPSLAYYLGHRGNIVDALDIDADVIAALTALPDTCSRRVYDAADQLPKELLNSASIAVLDPPWYEAAMRTFLDRALRAVELGGELILTFPPRPTRPGVEAARAVLLDDLMKAGHQILALERNHVQYLVPGFELAALSRRGSFAAIPWRTGDLLHFRKGNGSLPNAATLQKSSACSFSRNPLDFRVFIKGSATLPDNLPTYRLEQYSSNISTRAHPGEDPDIWTTEKVGLHIGRFDAVVAALKTWQNRATDKPAAFETLSKAIGLEYSRELIARLDEDLELWSRFADPPPLRTDDEIEAVKARGLTDWATKPSPREHSDPTDTFRGSFQRDRDRVLWSSALRRLSNKTQLFPYTYDDQLRQRLTHSIEGFAVGYHDRV